jgi:23S rRNA (adenine2503-C2)-methyltransferase
LDVRRFSEGRVDMKTELVGMNQTELEDFFQDRGEKRFRGRQVYRWIYLNLERDFASMTDLPLQLRQVLEEKARVTWPEVLEEKVSEDGTRKFLLELQDQKTIEMVLIPQPVDSGLRYTVCVSSQVGCPLRCSFCATGAGGFERNLKVHEIVGQVLLSRWVLARENTGAEPRLTNVVFMGMGEPFLNYDAVLSAIRLLTDSEGINMGQRHITVSTSGEVRGIRRLAEEGLQVVLAVSLHAARDSLRDTLVPLNRRYPLAELQSAVQYYFDKTGRRVTLEYILLNRINTNREDARALVTFTRPLLANVNLIPYNEIGSAGYECPPQEVVTRFRRWLEEAGVNTAIREERGADIDAACGQLKAKREDIWQENDTG